MYARLVNPNAKSADLDRGVDFIRQRNKEQGAKTKEQGQKNKDDERRTKNKEQGAKTKDEFN